MPKRTILSAIRILWQHESLQDFNIHRCINAISDRCIIVIQWRYTFIWKQRHSNRVAPRCLISCVYCIVHSISLRTKERVYKGRQKISNIFSVRIKLHFNEMNVSLLHTYIYKKSSLSRGLGSTQSIGDSILENSFHFSQE